jgi:allophanate hydrolase subunit 2
MATVISADLAKVAQLKPGDRVRFKPISIEEAHQLIRQQEERLRSFKEFFEQR